MDLAAAQLVCLLPQQQPSRVAKRVAPAIKSQITCYTFLKNRLSIFEYLLQPQFVISRPQPTQRLLGTKERDLYWTKRQDREPPPLEPPPCCPGPSCYASIHERRLGSDGHQDSGRLQLGQHRLNVLCQRSPNLCRYRLRLLPTRHVRATEQ